MRATHDKAPETKTSAASWSGELGGACGGLVTFVSLVVGAMTVAGVAPTGVLFGFGAFLIGAGLAFGIPVAVQPMKAVSAVLLTGDLDAGELGATGLVTGAILVWRSVTPLCLATDAGCR